VNKQGEPVATGQVEVDDALRQVSNIARYAQLKHVRFVECHAMLRERDGKTSADEAGITCFPQKVSQHSDRIEARLLFAFTAPSPLAGDSSRMVDVRAVLDVEYVLGPEWSSESRDALIRFGRINGIYNTWPYLREYLHTSLVRLGLPPFELPLLRVEQAVALAGTKALDVSDR